MAQGEAARGRFVVADSDQYMAVADRLRLRSGKSNVFDVDTVERYRSAKGKHFGSIREFFGFYCT